MHMSPSRHGAAAVAPGPDFRPPAAALLVCIMVDYMLQAGYGIQALYRLYIDPPQMPHALGHWSYIKIMKERGQAHVYCTALYSTCAARGTANLMHHSAQKIGISHLRIMHTVGCIDLTAMNDIDHQLNYMLKYN